MQQRSVAPTHENFVCRRTMVRDESKIRDMATNTMQWLTSHLQTPHTD